MARKCDRKLSRFRHAATAIFLALACPPSALSQEVGSIGQFALNVATHTVLHELGHAVFREFDIPILGNEENMADSFATIYITQTMQDDAVAIILDRARSWRFEDGEVEPQGYDHKGEHELDIRRAYQSACLLYGADPAEWNEARVWAGFSDADTDDCSDTAPDQIESWSRVLAPHLLPPDDGSDNVELMYGEGPMKDRMMASGLMERLAEIARRFDWSRPIILRFDHCDLGAYWNRHERTIMLCDDYVARFIDQGRAISTQ